MALGGVFMTDTDGNIGRGSTNSNEKVSGLLFDISKQKDFWTKGAGLALKDKLQGNVIELNSPDDMKELGIMPYTGKADSDLLFGIPYYHIDHFFKIQGEVGRLFIMFADCGQNWDAISQIQQASRGMISQLGVWTDQSLWKQTDPEAETYSIDLVSALQSKAASLAEGNAPLSILLSANTAVVDTADTPKKQVDLSKIPSCIINSRFVTVLLGQGLDSAVSVMQLANENATPVGTVGAALGCLALAHVQESIAWVNKFNLIGYFPDIELGFGDVTKSAEKFVSTLKYSSLSLPQLNTLDDLGYVFLCKYSGLESGVYFSKDQTCSRGDYRTIALNRTIHKSRRAIRNALLPYVNSPLRVDPSTGQLSAAQITMFQNIVNDILKTMLDNEEISGYVPASIDKNQNVLKTDTLIIKYRLVPVGVSARIEVTEGLALTNK